MPHFNKTLRSLKGRPGDKIAEPRCWLTEQPIEILVALLISVIETEETPEMATFLTLVLNFKEFAELTLVVMDSGPEETCLYRCGLLRVHVNNFSLCPRKQAHKRPVKVFQSRPPWIHLDIQAHPLPEAPGTWVSCALKPGRVSCHLLGPYPGFHLRACRAHDKNQLIVDYSKLDNSDSMEMKLVQNDRAEVSLYRQAYQDMDCWNLKERTNRSFGYDAEGTVSVVNCVNFRLATSLRRLTINIIDDPSLYYQNPIVLLSFIPRWRLHIVFSSYLVPDLVEHPDTPQYRWSRSHFASSDHYTFTLENTSWSYTNPYGYITAPHEGQTVRKFEDQATVNLVKRRQRLRHSPDEHINSIGYRHFPVVKLYGVPESVFLGMDTLKWAAHCFYWWRLSPRTADAMQCPDVTIHAPELKEFYLISVVRNCHTTPNFISPQLSKLVLISLDDSDAPWNLRQLLAGSGFLWRLKDVYLERRTYQSCSQGSTWIPINSYDLKPISLAVGRLHIRGYVPLFLLHHSLNPDVKLRFHMLVEMMLDISLIGHCHELKPSTGCGSGKAVTLIFSDFTYPCLKELTLMCSKEAHDSKALASLKIDITVPRKCRDVIISTLIEAESISLNGRLVITPEIFVGKRSAYEPLVPSRKCVRWKYKWLRRRFICCGEVLINNDSLSDIREY